MLLRRPSAPALLGLGAAVAGLVGVVSALTHEFADCSDVPPGPWAASRDLTAA